MRRLRTSGRCPSDSAWQGGEAWASAQLRFSSRCSICRCIPGSPDRSGTCRSLSFLSFRSSLRASCFSDAEKMRTTSHLALLKTWLNSVAAGVSPAEYEATDTVATTETAHASSSSAELSHLINAPRCRHGVASPCRHGVTTPGGTSTQRGGYTIYKWGECLTRKNRINEAP